MCSFTKSVNNGRAAAEFRRSILKKVESPNVAFGEINDEFEGMK